MLATVRLTTNPIILTEHAGNAVYEVTVFDPAYGPEGYTILHTGSLESVGEAFGRVGKRVLAGAGLGEYVLEGL